MLNACPMRYRNKSTHVRVVNRTGRSVEPLQEIEISDSDDITQRLVTKGVLAPVEEEAVKPKQRRRPQPRPDAEPEEVADTSEGQKV